MDIINAIIPHYLILKETNICLTPFNQNTSRTN